MKHIVSVIRNDNGEDEFGREFGGSYTELLADRKLPASYRIDARTASDSELFGAIARLVALYVSDLGLSRNDRGEYNGSPYDIFLALNKLPRMPADGESDLDYSRRLLKAVNNLDKPVFVTNRHGKFKTHDQPFLFAEQELAGMKIFFTGPGQDSRATSGNCIACHAAPHFSDFNFHNTGVSQAEYDDIHGAGQFMKLPVPNARQRSKNPDATGRFRSIPARNRPELADLGAWNIVLNKNMPKPQKKLRKLLCTDNINCDDDVLLNNALAAFKTPVIRDLEHSWPYLHNGSAKTIESVLNHYIESTARAKNATLRNPAKQLKNISIGPADIAPLAAFIRALNEDYE